MPGPFLRRRGGAYRLRVRVPSDLVKILGRTEVGRSLGTTDPRASRSRARTLHAQLEAAWERIRVAIETGTADLAWCAELMNAALRLAEATSAQVRAESLVALREAEHRYAVERREAAEERVAFVARVREGFEGLLSDQEWERRQAEQERAAGTLSPENLRVFHGLMGSAGVVMRSTPAPTVLDYLEGTYLDERRLKDAGRRHMVGYVRLFAKVLGNRPLNTFERKDVDRRGSLTP